MLIITVKNHIRQRQQSEIPRKLLEISVLFRNNLNYHKLYIFS